MPLCPAQTKREGISSLPPPAKDEGSWTYTAKSPLMKYRWILELAIQPCRSMIQQLQHSNTECMGCSDDKSELSATACCPARIETLRCEVLNLQDCICTSVRPMTGYTAHLWLLWWIHTVAITVRYNNRRTCTEYMCNVPLLATGCLLSLYQLCFRQPHPLGSVRTTGLMLWGAWRAHFCSPHKQCQTSWYSP